jgi:hypothetical protein
VINWRCRTISFAYDRTLPHLAGGRNHENFF